MFAFVIMQAALKQLMADVVVLMHVGRLTVNAALSLQLCNSRARIYDSENRVASLMAAV